MVENRADNPAMTDKAAAKKQEVVEVRKAEVRKAVAAAVLAVAIDKYKTIAPFLKASFQVTRYGYRGPNRLWNSARAF